jgi:hypothetical protein
MICLWSMCNPQACDPGEQSVSYRLIFMDWVTLPPALCRSKQSKCISIPGMPEKQ